MAAPVHIPYHQELIESMTLGGDMMASMIRQSLFEFGEMPPPDMFNWYVRNATYRLVAKRALLKVERATLEEVEASAQEVAALEVLLTENKQLGLLHEMSEVFRVAALAEDG